MNAKALILAAGAGTRMKSEKPKVAHEVLGKPLVRWVVDAAHDAGISDVISVLGHMSEKVAPLVESDTQIVIQTQQLGTGDDLRRRLYRRGFFGCPLGRLSSDHP